MITNKKKKDWKVEGRTEVIAWTQTLDNDMEDYYYWVEG